MANSVGSVSIDLSANIAKFQSDLGRAARIAEQQAAHIKSSLMGIAGALGATLSVAGIGLWVKSALDAQDAISKLSQKVNVSTETLSGWQLAAQQAGVESDAFQKGMIKLAQSSALANDGSKLQASAFKALGVSFTDATGHLKPMATLLPQVADAFAKAKDSTEKTVIATRLFGKAGADMIPMLNAGAKGLAEYTKMAEDFGLTVGGKSAKAAERFNDAVQQLGFVGKGVANQLTTSLAPALADLADKAVAFFRSGDWKRILNDIAAGAKYVADNIGNIISAVKLLGQIVVTVYAGKALYYGALWITSLAAQKTATQGLIVAQAQWGAATSASFGAAYKSIGALGIALNVVGAALVGWQIGKYIREQFLEAQLAAIAFVDGSMALWEKLKQGSNIAWQAIKQTAIGALNYIRVGLADLATAEASVLGKLPGGGGLAAQLTETAAKLRPATSAANDYKASVAAITAEANKNIKAIHANTDGMVDNAIAENNAKNAAAKHIPVLKDTRTALNLVSAAASTAADAMAKLYASTVKAFQDRIAADRETLSNGKALSDAEKARVKLLQDMADGTLKVTSAQRAFLLSLADTDVKLQKDIELQKQRAQGMANIIALTEKLSAGLQDQVDQNAIDALAVGHGQKVTQQLQAELAIRQKFQKEVDQLNKVANKPENVGTINGIGGEAYNTQLAEIAGFQKQSTELYRQGIADRQKLEANGMNGVHSAVEDFMDRQKNMAQQFHDFTTQAIDGFGDAFTKFASSAETAKQAFGSLIDSMYQQALKFVANKAIQALFDSFGASGKSATQGSTAGGWGSILGNLGNAFGFGGGHADGGQVSPGSFYKVNERGPELYTQGGNTYLMAGSQQGNVVPIRGGGRGGSTTNISVNVQPTSSRRTADQVATETARKQRTATARND